MSREGDFMNTPSVTAVRQCRVSRDAFVIMEIGMLLFHLAQFLMQIKRVRIASAVIEMDFFFMLMVIVDPSFKTVV